LLTQMQIMARGSSTTPSSTATTESVSSSNMETSSASVVTEIPSSTAGVLIVFIHFRILRSINSVTLHDQKTCMRSYEACILRSTPFLIHYGGNAGRNSA
jgi:hypothetical protein